MTTTTRLYTLFFGELVGHDAFGNRYYRRKGAGGAGKGDRRRDRRWVQYANSPLLAEFLGGARPDPSRVPAEWHGWLHYTTDLPPPRQPHNHYAWEKPHLPNLTGTPGAYLPPGHLLKGGEHAPTISEYQPWRP